MEGRLWGIKEGIERNDRGESLHKQKFCFCFLFSLACLLARSAEVSKHSLFQKVKIRNTVLGDKTIISEAVFKVCCCFDYLKMDVLIL